MNPKDRPTTIRKLSYILSYDPENFMQALIRGTKSQALQKLREFAEIIALAPTEFLAGL